MCISKIKTQGGEKMKTLKSLVYLTILTTLFIIMTSNAYAVSGCALVTPASSAIIKDATLFNA
mgnify:FL=1